MIDVIYNPRGAWPRHERRVRELLGDSVQLRPVATGGPGDAGRLARDAIAICQAQTESVVTGRPISIA